MVSPTLRAWVKNRTSDALFILSPFPYLLTQAVTFHICVLIIEHVARSEQSLAQGGLLKVSICPWAPPLVTHCSPDECISRAAFLESGARGVLAVWQTLPRRDIQAQHFTWAPLLWKQRLIFPGDITQLIISTYSIYVRHCLKSVGKKMVLVGKITYYQNRLLPVCNWGKKVSEDFGHETEFSRPLILIFT